MRFHHWTLAWMAALFLLLAPIWRLAPRPGGEWTHGTFFRFLLYLPTPIRVSVPWCLPVAEVELELGPKCHPPGGFNQNRGWFLRNAAATAIVSYVGSIVRSGAWKLVPSSAFPLAIVAP